MATQKKTLSAGQKSLQENKGYNSLYRNYIAQGKTPQEAESLASMTYGATGQKTTKTGTQTPIANSNIWKQDTSFMGTGEMSASDSANAFNKQWGDFISASQQAYGIETGRGLEQYQQKRQDTDIQRQRNAEDYTKYTGREQQDFNRNLAMRDKDFATKLSQAANAYGQRGLLTGGVFKKASGGATADFGEENIYLKTLSQRKMEDLAQAQARGEQDITKSLERLGTSESQYRTDRDVGSKALGLELQTKGDTLYNEAQTALYGIQQEQARQEALDKQYGIKTTPRIPTYRLGGKFITK